MEEWKAVSGTHGMIEVSNYGNARSLLRGFPYVLKTQYDSKGYKRFTVSINHSKRTYKLHREVAKAFIDNPGNLPQVNHIDGNKDNNRADNLEWISNKDNANHAISTGLWSSVIAGAKKENDRRKKPVIAVSLTDNSSIWFESVAAAERHFDSRHIVDVIKGKRSQCKGYSFSYESEVMQ